MANTTEGRRQVRADALGQVRQAVVAIRAPAGRPQGWVTEFNRGVAAVVRLLENQIAQAEGRVRSQPKRAGGGRSGRHKPPNPPG
jgi:hypothetical protein